HVHPALAHERYVAHDPGRGVAGQVPHDVVLELLGLPDGDPPVLGVGDHVAHIEVVRQDAGLTLEREAQVEQVGRGGVDAAHQYPLVADVADADIEGGLGGLRDEGRQGLRVVDVGVDGQVDPAPGGGAGEAFHAFDDLGL